MWKSRILAANCTGCHVTGGIAPFELVSYASTKLHGSLINDAITTHVMPPWMPSDDTPAILGTRTLTDAQIKTVTTWISEGMEEGNPADSTVTGPPPGFAADATMQIASPYTPNSSLGTDDYHCFVIDPQLTVATAITALNIEPGDRRVVHHVIVYAVGPSDLAQLHSLEAGGSGNGYTCFGSSGINSATTVGGWIPGTTASYFPEGTGVILEPGSQIVLQVHYNLLTIQDTTDRITAQSLQYAAASSDAGGLRLPARSPRFFDSPGRGAERDRDLRYQRSRYPRWHQDEDLGRLAAYGDLHGTDIQVSGTHADGTGFEFVHIPKWNFSWQEMYFYEEPITVVERRQSLTLSCTFDNTQANQPVINGVQETPVTLTWGEDTLNEMCLSFIYGTLTE